MSALGQGRNTCVTGAHGLRSLLGHEAVSRRVALLKAASAAAPGKCRPGDCVDLSLKGTRGGEVCVPP